MYKLKFISTKNTDYQDFKNKLEKLIAKTKNINNEAEFDNFISAIANIANSQKFKFNNSSKFEKELALISKNGTLVEKTNWGGVALKKVDVEKDYIRKLLIVKNNGILGFEIHNQKLEKLKVLEGIFLVLYASHKKDKNIINLKIGTKNSKFIFYPKDEHGIIALTNGIIQETSTNHLDDLVYIFKY